MHKNDGEINIDKIKKMFPEDKDLHEHLENMQKEFEENQQNTIKKYNQDKLLKRAQSKNYQRKQTQNSKLSSSTLNNEDDKNNKTRTLRSRPKTSVNRMNKTNTKKPKVNQNIPVNLSTSIQIQEHPPINKNEQLNENKINNMVTEYTKKLMNDFLKFCEKEKKANKERDKLINEASDEKEKKRLAKILALQRGQSSDKIGEYNKMIDDKIEDYKDKLYTILNNQNNNQ